MSDIEIRRVSDRRMRKIFVMFPWTSGIYDNDPAWIPPVISDQMKFFNPKKGYFFDIGEAEFFLAWQDGRPVGRITAQVNHLYEKKYDNHTGFFGFFESVNSKAVADTLFNAASDWLKKKGKTVMQGPHSFSIYDSVGFETEGAEIMPVVGLFHFAPYYKDLAEGCGFQKCIDWSCWLVRDIDDYAPYLTQVKEEFMKGQGITYETMKRRDMKRRAKEIQEIFNTAWEGNWGHLPLTDKQFETFYEELKMVSIPELTIFAEDMGKTVGFCVSIADANPGLKILNGRLYPWRLFRALREIKKSRKIRTIIMGVLPEYRGRKIDDVFYLKTIETGVGMGFNQSDCSLIVETNVKMINALKALKAERYKTYRIYEKQI